MGLERGSFVAGAARFPLTASTENDLLQDADPAIYYVIDFLAWSIENYLGARLRTQGGTIKKNFQEAVARTISVEPTPFLQQPDLLFPILGLYRKEDAWSEHAVSFDKSVSQWELVYILPPLTPVEANTMQPFLRAVSSTIRRQLHVGQDPGYKGGRSVVDDAKLWWIRHLKTSYGAYSRIENLSQYYRTIVCTIEVCERSTDDVAQFDDYAGTDANIGVAAPGEETLDDVVDASSFPSPTVASVSPSSGSFSGGTSVTIVGTGFRPNTRPAVLFGGAAADGVVVVDATHITCSTPSYEALSSVAVDVTVVDSLTGLAGTLASGFTFTNP